MKPQEIFDTVVNHLRTQGKPARSAPNACKYRLHEDGKVLKCAVGCLIPDEIYDPVTEGQNIYGLVNKENHFNVPDYFADNLDLLFNLQKVHDSRKNLTPSGNFDHLELETSIRKVSKEFKLTYTSPRG